MDRVKRVTNTKRDAYVWIENFLLQNLWLSKTERYALIRTSYLLPWEKARLCRSLEVPASSIGDAEVRNLVIEYDRIAEGFKRCEPFCEGELSRVDQG